MNLAQIVVSSPKRSRPDKGQCEAPRCVPREDEPRPEAPSPPPAAAVTHVHQLPSELLLLIFSFCSTEELQDSVSKVCRRWQELAERPCLRVSLALSSEDAPTVGATEQLRAMPNLRDLRLVARSDAASLVRAVTSFNNELRRLTVKACSDGDCEALSGDDLKALLRRCSKLLELTVKASPCKPLGGPLFEDPDMRLGKIRKLNFNFVSFLTLQDVQNIAERCPKLEDLRMLVRRDAGMQPLHFRDDEMRLLSLHLHETLRVLKIDAHHVTDSGMISLATCRRLSKLWLRHASQVSDAGLRRLQLLSELEDLELTSMSRVSSRGWASVFKKRCWPNLRRLSLIFCTNVDNETTSHFGRTCPHLEKLNVAGCYFLMKEGLKNVFVRCFRLREVTLCLTQVKGCLYWIPTCAPLIKKIAYHSCYLVSEPHDVVKEYEVVLKMFSKRYPNLQIQLIQCLDELTSGD